MTDRLNLSFVKDKHTQGKKMAANGPNIVIYQLLFFESWPQATSEAITFELIKI